MVTPEVVGALELPPDFASRIERAGMLVRDVDGGVAFTYHPLLREFLLERLDVELGEDERRRLHGSVARAVAEGGDTIEAIEHWLKAHDWDQAVSAIEREGPLLVRTAGGLMRRWFSLLPEAARALPTIRSLEGQLAWASGDNEGAVVALQGAIRGFEEHPNPPADWLARSVLIDSLFATGGISALEVVVDGWDQPEAEPAGGARAGSGDVRGRGARGIRALRSVRTAGRGRPVAPSRGTGRSGRCSAHRLRGRASREPR